MSIYYGFDTDTKYQFIISAQLHDLGKLAIPNTILDKPRKLTKHELEIVEQHTYFTRAMLSKVSKFENITEWASNHHEKLDGKGYPYGFDQKHLDFNSRLLCCLDIYQALTEERPYRKSMHHLNAMKILYTMASSHKIDKQIVTDIDFVFK